MGSTKIIHVLRNDKFEDIFDLFKNSEAHETIFIFPKGSKFARQSQHFEAIKKEAETSDKAVSIMSADPVVTQFASKYGLSLLEAPEPSRRKSKTSPPPVSDASPEQDQEEDVPSEPIVPNETDFAGAEELAPELPVELEPATDTALSRTYDFIETPPENAGSRTYEENPDVELTASRNIYRPAQPSGGKTIKDILRPEPERAIEIKGERGRAFDVEIKSHLQDTSPADDITKVWAQGESRKNSRQFFAAGNKPKFFKSFKKTTRIFIIVAIIIFISILYGTLGSAKITIWPTKQDINFQLKVSASITATAANLEFNRIPGQRFTDKEEESDAFPATSQKNIVQKASGEITIFNKSSSSQRLVATTRFKTPDGLIFRIPQTITVPAATKTGSITQEGSIRLPVYADKPGPEYNISPASFTIPGFEGTPKFNDFYAKSDKPMAGGIIGPSKMVTEEDFAKAQETLTSKLRDRILKSLKGQTGDLKIADSALIKFETPTTNAKVGGGAENLQMTIRGSADIIAFRESDILALIRNFIEKSGDVELLSKNLTIDYINPQMSADNSTLDFSIRVAGQIAAKIDKNKILKDITGMKESEIRAYFDGNKKQIESARILLSPFWVKRIPENPEKITVILDKN